MQPAEYASSLVMPEEYKRCKVKVHDMRVKGDDLHNRGHHTQSIEAAIRRACDSIASFVHLLAPLTWIPISAFYKREEVSGKIASAILNSVSQRPAHRNPR